MLREVHMDGRCSAPTARLAFLLTGIGSCAACLELLKILSHSLIGLAIVVRSGMSGHFQALTAIVVVVAVRGGR